MAVELDHFIVSARDQRASAELLAGLLGVPWSPTGVGPFSPVYLNDGLTLDFIDDAAATLPVEHYCFRVGDAEFDATLRRLEAAGIRYRSTVRGPDDMQVGTAYGGRNVYWNVPDGHQWEMLTVSYARAPQRAAEEWAPAANTSGSQTPTPSSGPACQRPPAATRCPSG